MEINFKIIGDFVELIQIHYKLINHYEDDSYFDYKGISIVKRDKNFYELSYKLVMANLYNNYIYETGLYREQSENFRRTEFYKNS